MTPIEEWVPAYRRLMKGSKKHLKRGVRFVLLEVAMEARPKGGALDLPVSWTTEKAIHDLIGGDLKEIKAALKEFTKPDEDGVAPWRIERDATKHRLEISKWDLWTGRKSSTRRVQLHRARNKNEDLPVDVTLGNKDHETHETPYRTEQNRTVENKTDPPLPPEGGEEEVSSPTDQPSGTHRVVVHDGGGNSTYDLAWNMWRALYEQSRRQYGRYVEDWINDKRVIQRLGENADRLTDSNRAATTELLRHWFTSYLRDDGAMKFIATARHPLRFIEKQITTYGEPKRAAVRLAKIASEPMPSDEELQRIAIEAREKNKVRFAAMAAGVGAKKGVGG